MEPTTTKTKPIVVDTGKTGVLEPGDRVVFSYEYLRDQVFREFLGGLFPTYVPEHRQVRVHEIRIHSDGTKDVVVTNADEHGKPLPGWDLPGWYMPKTTVKT